MHSLSGPEAGDRWERRLLFSVLGPRKSLRLHAQGRGTPDRGLKTQIVWALEQMGGELIVAMTPEVPGRCEEDKNFERGQVSMSDKSALS